MYAAPPRRLSDARFAALLMRRERCRGGGEGASMHTRMRINLRQQQKQICTGEHHEFRAGEGASPIKAYASFIGRRPCSRAVVRGGGVRASRPIWGSAAHSGKRAGVRFPGARGRMKPRPKAAAPLAAPLQKHRRMPYQGAREGPPTR
jgi:hypothetical protein